MDINAILENEDDLLGYTCLFKGCSVFKFLNYEPLFDSLQQNLFFHRGARKVWTPIDNIDVERLLFICFRRNLHLFDFYTFEQIFSLCQAKIIFDHPS